MQLFQTQVYAVLWVARVEVVMAAMLSIPVKQLSLHLQQ